MTKDDCYYLGKITKTHGVKGEVSLWLDVDFIDDYAEMDSVLLDIKGELVPFFIKELQIRNKRSIAKFEDIDSIEKAQPIIGADMYLPLDVLPKLADNQFYYHEIADFQIIDQVTNEVLGTVKAVYEGSHQDLIAMEYQEKEVLIPINDAIVKSVNREKKELYVELPEGLIDLYLD